MDERNHRQRAEAGYHDADAHQDAPAPLRRWLAAGRRCCGPKQRNAPKENADDQARWNDSHSQEGHDLSQHWVANCDGILHVEEEPASYAPTYEVCAERERQPAEQERERPSAYA